MLLKGQLDRGTGLKTNRTLLAGLLLIVFVLATLRFTRPLLPMSAGDNILCNAEQIRGNSFVHNGFSFNNASTQSSEEAHTGRFSCKIGKDMQYGFSYEEPHPTPGAKYKISVWRKRNDQTPGNLVVSSPDGSFYQSTHLPVRKKANGWELLEHYFHVPFGKTLEKISIYVYKPHSNIVYFDDLMIERLADGTNYKAFKPKQLVIDIPEKGMNKLANKRKSAMRQGILINSDEDWAKGEIIEADHKKEIRLRLKGDWLDHLNSDKWSCRIKVKAPEAWNRMVTFSIQNPVTRNYLSEYFYHQLLEKEDILTTRFDFIKFRLNGVDMGTYLYEEHFEKQLVEYRLRREGPIIRFSEDEYWNGYKRHYDKFGNYVSHDHKKPAAQAAPIQPFGGSKTAVSPTLSKQFEIARDLLEQFRNGSKPPAELFDIERLAKFYAITDVCAAFHGLTWHNQRFYYNPVTTKLEPIGFDGFAENFIPNAPGDGFFIAEGVFNRGYEGVEMYKQLFYDPTFISKYHSYLNYYSSPDYINQFFLELEPGLTEREQFLQEEFPEYKFDKAYLINRSKNLQSLIYPYNETGIKAWTQEKTGNTKTVSLANFHFSALEIIGTGNAPRKINQKLDQPLLVFPINKLKRIKYEEIAVPLNAKYIIYGVPGIDSLFSTPISSFRSSMPTAPTQALWEGIQLKSNAVYTVTDQQITFRAGEHRVTSDIIIPAGFQVVFEPGTQLNLIQKAKFISKSPVRMRGTEEFPIKIYSSDKSANGFTVLDAPRQSTLSYVLFEDMNTLNYEGWLLTGAVTFYESDVQMTHCAFTKNHCEDALNTVRCDFKMTNCLVSETYGDGFDADFCKGSIVNSRFFKTGNDAIDFSTSTIDIKNCKIELAGDKGISVGEQATVSVTETLIDGAVIGLASKDLSQLTVNSVTLRNCRQGFAAYQKKPEYGGATILVKKYDVNNIRQLHLIEKGSKLLLNDKLIGSEQVKNERQGGLELIDN